MLLTLNRRNINYDEPKEALQSLHEYVNILTDELNFVLCHLDQRNIPFIGKRFQEMQDGFSLMQTWQSSTESTISSMSAGLEVQANAQIASAALIAKVVNASGQIKAASIVAAVNALGETEARITADRINLNGVTSMNGLTNISQTLIIGEGASYGVINFPLTSYIENMTEQLIEKLEIGSPNVVVKGNGDTGSASLTSVNKTVIESSMEKTTGYTLLWGRNIRMTNLANQNGSGGIDTETHVIGSLSYNQRVFIGITGSGKLRVVVQEGSSTNGHIYEFTPG